ncbi:MAG: response regulator [Gomphosphaeria aponina SAG 52.96 = DSM 107014]|uniref:Response regulator n=1 Tax=Gomphosphaeria aponina SAG 52.96 = DSM 107014 TaxID=1521640 RepID=A0A941JR66_9CHRO|nr:response regulator [Gomphosphaeria aponina SAG 52.96 = DSM 107014]
MKILIIDDEPRLLAIAKMSLEMMAQWKVLTATSGYEGLELAASERPDAILLDMMMPELNGNETLVRLQANRETKNIPVFLLTAKSNLPENLAELGVKAVIHKPFNPVKLAEAIALNLNWDLGAKKC